jgi:hypothetical protein
MVLGGFLSYRYAEIGMIVGLVIPLFILQWIIMNIYYFKRIKLDIVLFFKNILSLLVMYALLIVIFYTLFKQLEISWMNFILKAFVYVIVAGLSSYLLMNTYEKKLISKKLS